MSTASIPPVSQLPAQFGRYRLEKQLSQGERTFTYLAQDTQLGRAVVLKLFQFHANEVGEGLPRFLQQVRAASTVAHPNLCPLYEVGQGDQLGYVAMAYIPGKRLSEVLEGGKALTPRQAASATRKLAQALQEAHRNGLVHRNLKPSNIIVGPSKEPVVMNLGLLRQATPASAFDTVIGKVRNIVPYLAPEQLVGDDRYVGPAADVYALGAILYEMLTGRAPFQGQPAEVLAKVRSQEPALPSTYRSDLLPAMDAICKRALAKQPQERFPSMAEFAAALGEYLRKDSEAAAPAGAIMATPVQGGPPPHPLPVAAVGAGPPPAIPAAAADFHRPVGRSAGPVVWPWIVAVSVLLFAGLGLGGFFLIRAATDKDDQAKVVHKDEADKDAEENKDQDKRAKDQKKPKDSTSTDDEEEPDENKSDPDFTAPKVEEPDKAVPVVRIERKIQVSPLGDADIQAEIKMPPDQHARFKKMLSRPKIKDGKVDGFFDPKMANVLRFLELETPGALLEKFDGKFDTDAIKVSGIERGWAKNREGRWVCQLTTDPRQDFKYIKKQGQVATLQALQKENGRQKLVRLEITLPPGAHTIAVKGKPSQLVFKALRPKPGPAPKRKPSLELETKPHIMSALYKLYGDRRFGQLWVGRAVFQNRGVEKLTDYRVKFRLSGYSEWSRWERCDVVYPGQTVVDPYYPVIDTKIKDLHGSNLADIEVKYQYRRPGGKLVEDSHSERIKILGINDGVYSDLPFSKENTWYENFKDAPLVLASFTTATDPVMHDVLGILTKQIGGANASATDLGARRFLEALYNLFRANITYEGAKGDQIDGVLHQHLKYGRDVLRTKSGTCVNLAILYASVAETAGLKASIILIPGHAFPAVRLPQSGQLIFVETTGCGGGTLATSRDYAFAVSYATQNFQNWAKLGLLMKIDIGQLRLRGVTPPELPDVGRNPLKDWSIVPPNIVPTGTTPPTTQNPPPRTTPKTTPQPVAALLGVWDVTAKAKTQLAFFDGAGKFGLGTDLTKPVLQGTYTYANNTLTLIVKTQRLALPVTWSVDGNAFEYTNKDGTKLVFRRKALTAVLKVLKQEHNATVNNRKGMKIYFSVSIYYAPGLVCEVTAFFRDSKNQLVKAKHKGQYSSSDGYLATFIRLTPNFLPGTFWKELTLFIPYDEFSLQPGKNDLKFLINVWCLRDRKFIMPTAAVDSFSLTAGK
jgi:hypothetical protein